MKIDEYFDNVYLLNLHKRPQRLAISKERMGLCDIQFETFGGTDGSVMRKLWESYYAENQYFSNPSYIGCAISHLAIYRDAIEKGYDRILIVEDDNKIKHDANAAFEICAAQLPEWDELLYLGYIPLNEDCTMWDYNVNNGNFINSNVFTASNLWGLYAYGISKKLMLEILDVYDREFPMEIDRYFVKNIQPRGLSYAITPQLFAATDGYSDNSGIAEAGMLERSIDARYASQDQYV